MSVKWSRLLKIGLPVLLVAGLVIGLAGTVLASPKHATVNANAAAKVIAGKVTAKGADTFVVQSANQTLTTLRVNADTKYFQVPRALPNRLPGKLFECIDGKGRLPLQRVLSSEMDSVRKLSKTATFADLAVGDRVVVRLVSGQDVAKEVLIIKPLPAKSQNVTGTIALVTANATGNGGQITVNPTAGGTPIALTWDSDTSFVLKGAIEVVQGRKVTVVYNPTTLKAVLVRVATP